MAVSGVDYTRSLSKQKEDFRDMANRMREDKRSEIANMKQVHRDQKIKQSKNYRENFDKVRENFKSEVDAITDRAQKFVERKSDDFKKTLQRQEYQASKERFSKQKEFDRRLHGLNDKYQDIIKQLDEENELKTANTTDRHRKSLRGQEMRHRDEIQKISENVKEKTEKSRLAHATDRRRLVDKNAKKLEDIFRENKKNQILSKEQFKNQVDRIEENNVADRSRLKSGHDQHLKRLHKIREDQLQGQTEEFKQLQEKNRVQQADEQRKTSRLHNDQLNKLQTDNRKEVDNLRRLLRQFGQRQEEGDSYSDRVASIESNYRARLRRLYEYMQDIEKNSAEKNDINRTEFREDLRDIKTEFSNKNDKLARDYHRRLFRKETENNEIVDRLSKNFDQRTKETEEISRRRLDRHKRDSKRLFNNQRSNFSNSLDKVVEDNQEELRSIKKGFADKTNVLTEKNNTEKNELLQSLREEFQRKLDTSRKVFEERLDNKDQEIDNLKLKFQMNYEALKTQADKDIAFLRHLAKEQSEEDKKVTRLILENKENERLIESKKTLRGHQKELRRIQHENDLKVRDLINNYEARLQQLRTDTDRETKSKKKELTFSQLNLKNQTEVEKANLIEQYETKIAKLKRSHDIQLANIREAQRRQFQKGEGD